MITRGEGVVGVGEKSEGEPRYGVNWVLDLLG